MFFILSKNTIKYNFFNAVIFYQNYHIIYNFGMIDYELEIRIKYLTLYNKNKKIKNLKNNTKKKIILKIYCLV